MQQRSSGITAESPPEERIEEIIRRLRREHPDARCELDHESPLELLVATILSAQCTDERVNEVTPELFANYADAASFAQADRGKLESQVRPTGFFRQKAKFIQESCRIIDVDFGGAVPDEMDDLTALPGVARKTANVVLGVAFGKAEGVVVDTHVMRLSKRLGLTQERARDKIEGELMELVAQSDWIDFAHLLIFHGRRVCTARSPACHECALVDLCPSAVI